MAIGALVVRLVAPVAVLAAGVAALHHALTWRVRGHYFDSDGIRLHYTDEGQGTPVVLLHGLAVQSDLNWRRPGVIKALARHFRVISLDLRGHGLSDKPHEVAAYGATMAQDAVRLLDHLAIERAHVAGYSLGGFLALKLAALHQDRLFGAALLGAGWESPSNSTFLDAVPQLAGDLEAGHGIAPLSAYLGGERPAPGRLHSLAVRLMTGWFSDGKALACLLRSLAEIAVTEADLARIAVPICGIVGSRDPFRPSAEALVGRLRSYRLVIVEDADHLSALARKSTIAALENFLRTAGPVGS